MATFAGVAVLALAGPGVARAASARNASAVDLPPAPSAQRCAGVRAHRTLPVTESFDARPGAPRVFAIQYKQDLTNVVTYDSFRVKIECLLREDVLPRLAPDRPNVVVLNEDIGLATIATGSRGAAARDLFGHPGSPSCEAQGAPCATLAALAAVSAAYSPQIAAYHRAFPALGSVSQAFVGATDTLVRGFMGTFSGLAHRYGVYMVGSTDVAPFGQSTASHDVTTFGDPDLRPPPDSVYVASAPQVYNTAFMWGPHDVRGDGPDVLRNVVLTNRKVPLTPIENELQFTPGPSRGPAAVDNLRPFPLPGTDARIGVATSLPAFVYGQPPPGVNPCSDTAAYYMRCLNALGTNLVIQDEANPGRWSGPDGDGVEKWQPLSWMSSTYRTVSDLSVAFDYNVTAMMVGNLADLPFDGQSAITQRGSPQGAGCHYVGNAAFLPSEDRPDLQGSAGAQPGFLAIAPWVAPDGPRAGLRAVGAALAPGSRAPLENDYAETAIVADLPFPPDRSRAGCATSRAVSLGAASMTPGATRGRCVSRRTVTITLPSRRRRRGGHVRRVEVYVGGHLQRVLLGARRRVRVALAGRPRGAVRVRVVVFARGARRQVRRRYHLCVARRAGQHRRSHRRMPHPGRRRRVPANMSLPHDPPVRRGH